MGTFFIELVIVEIEYGRIHNSFTIVFALQEKLKLLVIYFSQMLYLSRQVYKEPEFKKPVMNKMAKDHHQKKRIDKIRLLQSVLQTLSLVLNLVSKIRSLFF